MPDIGQIVSELYLVAGKRLGAYGYVLTGSQHEGEELVQAAVVKTFVKRRQLDNVGSAEAYVRATMRTMHVDRIRRDLTWRRLVPKVTRTEEQADASAAVDAHDQIARALAALPPQVRAAVALRFYDDMTVAQIAAQMRLADGTVKQYLAQGRAILAPLLGVGEHDVERVSVSVSERSRS